VLSQQRPAVLAHDDFKRLTALEWLVLRHGNI
jgi:hypothetical protein